MIFAGLSLSEHRGRVAVDIRSYSTVEPGPSEGAKSTSRIPATFETFLPQHLALEGDSAIFFRLHLKIRHTLLTRESGS